MTLLLVLGMSYKIIYLLNFKSADNISAAVQIQRAYSCGGSAKSTCRQLSTILLRQVGKQRKLIMEDFCIVHLQVVVALLSVRAAQKFAAFDSDKIFAITSCVTTRHFTLTRPIHSDDKILKILLTVSHCNICTRLFSLCTFINGQKSILRNRIGKYQTGHKSRLCNQCCTRHQLCFTSKLSIS